MSFELSKEYRSKLKKLGVAIVYLFGSRATQSYSKTSDIDIGVVLKNPSRLKDVRTRQQIYTKLYQIFTEVFDKNFASEIDIVFLQLASYSLQFEALNYGEIIFESSSEFRADYEEYVMKKYIDFKPILEKFYQATLKRIE